MNDDLESGLVPGANEAVGPKAIDPHAMARRDLKSSLPKRFYKDVTVAELDGAFRILLDGRTVRTPLRNHLAVPGAELANTIAGEWAAQQEYIDPAVMPLTRIVNSALDGVAREEDAVAAEIVKYAGSDLLCYRAGDPEALVEEQAAGWDPLIAWMRDACGAQFILAEGVMFATQPEPAISAFRNSLQTLVDAGRSRPLLLAGLHVMTTLTGSAILALAVGQLHMTAQGAWAAAHVDEEFQARFWGEDAEAADRRARRWLDMQAAARMVLACR
jgi:chaperone required for assembly of F1-ATPase